MPSILCLCGHWHTTVCHCGCTYYVLDIPDGQCECGRRLPCRYCEGE